MLGLAPEAWLAIRLSLQVALVATLVSLPVAIWVALLLARGRFRGKQVLNVAVHLPLVLPPVVTGYVLLLSFGRAGIFGPFLDMIGFPLAFRWTGAVLAAAVMAFPLMVRAIRLGVEAVDTRIEEAAATLGASPWVVFRTVTLPLITPAILAGAVLAFAKALGEFGATITFVAAIPGETQTIASAIYGYLQVPGGEPQVLGLALVSSAIAVVALLISEVLARRARPGLQR